MHSILCIHRIQSKTHPSRSCVCAGILCREPDVPFQNPLIFFGPFLWTSNIAIHRLFRLRQYGKHVLCDPVGITHRSDPAAFDHRPRMRCTAASFTVSLI